MYSQQIPDEIQSELLTKAKDLITEAFLSYETSDFFFVLCRPTKMIRRKEVLITKNKIKPGMLRLILESDLEVFYLSRCQYRNGIKLVKSLIEIERLSYLIDFSTKFSYTGSFLTLKNATTAPAYDNDNNYDSLETLGDCILKTMSSLFFYLKHPDYDEGKLTCKRTKKINNKFLAEISYKNEFFYYLRGVKLNPKNFRPAHYCGDSLKQESFTITEKFSHGTLADMVESLIGAHFIDFGLLSAAKFVEKLKLLPFTPTFLNYFKNDYKSRVSPSSLENFEYKKFSDLIPEPSLKFLPILKDYSILENTINYKFSNKLLLIEALTHKSFSNEKNYERLEFLGDSVLDTIVLSNMFVLGKFSAQKLTNFRHMLVNNNIFAKMSLSLGLHRFLLASKEVYEEISKFLQVFV